MQQTYKTFLTNLSKRLRSYTTTHAQHIHCQAGCSSCCKTGDYPISQLELEYLMQGFISLDNQTKTQIQENIKTMVKGGACPFLIDDKCSVYPFRPIICRVHGLAYLCKDNLVKVPYCANEGKNYDQVYSNGEIEIEPITENLDTPNLLKDFDFGEIRNLYGWLH